MSKIKAHATLEVKASRIHGRGLFSSSPIEKGGYIGRFEGEPTTENDEHVLWYEENGRWQGLYVQNILRYINHSKDPNTEVVGRDLFAVRQIKAGEELTFDYGEEWD